MRKISGTTDVVIAEIRNIRNDTLRNSVHALMELKKPENMSRTDHNPQVVCEHLAASYLNPTRTMVSVLTDLNGFWTFYWYAENEDGPGVALHKLTLNCEERAAGQAKYLLEGMLTLRAMDLFRLLLSIVFRWRVSLKN